MLLVISPVVPFAKESKNNSKILQEKTHKHKVSKKSKKKKLAKRQKVRTAQNINKPKEGEILKIEAMVKDINEQ